MEMMVKTGVDLVILGALATGWIALQKSYSAVDHYSDSLSQQTRALDYMVRDARNALTVVAATNSLTLTIPNYYSSWDSQGNPTGTPADPTITGSTVDYGNSAKPINIVYALTNGNLTRQVTITATGATSTSTVVSGVDDVAFVPNDSSSYVSITISFAGRFRGTPKATDAKTALTAVAYLRNLRRN